MPMIWKMYSILTKQKFIFYSSYRENDELKDEWCILVSLDVS